jgi:isopenicillin N synthase-like dioxygenase
MSRDLIPELSYKKIATFESTTLSILSEALKNHGFFTIIDHGINDNLLDDSYDLAKKFFDLDETVKINYSRPEHGGARGYTPFGKETALGEKVPDLKEFWHHGPQVDGTYDKRIKGNLSVKEIDNFGSHFDDLFTSLNDLGMGVLSAIANVLDLDKDFFDNWVLKGNSVLRLIHYPPVSDSSNLQRARAHEDINLITLLVGAEESGLEVLSKSGKWIPIESRSKSIVCNIGDMMQLVTRGKLKSTTHRVVEYGEGEPKSRYSMPFFLHPSPEIILRSIVDDSKDSVSAHDFLEERIRAIKLY